MLVNTAKLTLSEQSKSVNAASQNFNITPYWNGENISSQDSTSFTISYDNTVVTGCSVTTSNNYVILTVKVCKNTDLSNGRSGYADITYNGQTVRLLVEQAHDNYQGETWVYEGTSESIGYPRSNTNPSNIVMKTCAMNGSQIPTGSTDTVFYGSEPLMFKIITDSESYVYRNYRKYKVYDSGNVYTSETKSEYYYTKYNSNSQFTANKNSNNQTVFVSSLTASTNFTLYDNGKYRTLLNVTVTCEGEDPVTHNPYGRITATYDFDGGYYSKNFTYTNIGCGE